jgi:AcrR family transcriptional regulator
LKQRLNSSGALLVETQHTAIRDDTRERLLAIATLAFASQGYAQASVRSMTKAAGVNVAAVNYHFGSKAELYRNVVRAQFAVLSKDFTPAVDEPLPIRTWLRTFYAGLLANWATPEKRSLAKILAFEESQPSGVLGSLLGEVIKPRHDELARVMAQEIGCSETPADVHRLVKALMDLVKGYIRDKPVLDIVAPHVYAMAEWQPVALDSLVEQGMDLIEGTRRRYHQNT